MKKFIFLVVAGLSLILIGIVFMKEESFKIPITEFFTKKTISVTLGEKNKYYRNYDFSYVQNTDDFVPDCKQDLLNIYYTAINAGKNEFTFYCSPEYESCIKDLESISSDENVLSLINNYVHPYNGFKHIETLYDELGEITILIHKSYTETDIAAIEEKLNIIEQSAVNPNGTPQENIKAIHDYIINNAKYDTERKENDISPYKSDIAYGPLIQGQSICSGYTDAMQLMLERLNIENFKVASENHVWNAVKVDNVWKHLDLTWDDPITDIGLDWLTYDYYLVSTKELLKLDQTEHTFDQNIYTELKEA